MKFFIGWCLGLLWTASALAMPNLNDYLGTWQVEKKSVYGCSDSVTIKKDPKKDSVTMTIQRGDATYTLAVLQTPSFKSPPEGVIADYGEYKLLSSSSVKFIRGKIVSASIWAPDHNNWLGVGIKTWFLEKGKLVKRKAGITMQDGTHKSPKEKTKRLFKLDNKSDVILRWKVQCKYVKSSLSAQPSQKK